MALEDLEIYQNRYLMGSMIDILNEIHTKILDNKGFLYFDLKS